MTLPQLAGWAIVGFVLIAAAEMPVTSELAIAFAYLVLVSVLLTSGVKALTNLQTLVNTGA